MKCKCSDEFVLDEKRLPKLLKPAELGEVLGESERFARRLMSREDFPKIRNGSRFLAITHLLDDYLESLLGEEV